MWILEIILAVAIIVAIVKWQALTEWFGGKKTASGPLSRYQEKIDEGAESLRHAKAGLDRCRTLLNSLQRQVDDGNRDVARLDARIKAALGEGNEERATECAEQLQAARASLEENTRQLAINKEAYQAFLAQVRASQEKISAAKRDAESLGSQLQTSQAEGDLADLADKLSAEPAVGGLKPEREAVLESIDASRAKVQTAMDLNAGRQTEVSEEDRSRKAEAQALVAEYKAKMPPKGPSA